MDKDRYYKALMLNNGHLNDEDLGIRLGFDEVSTQKILSQLLSEYKIEYTTNRACNYNVTKKTK